MSRTAHSLPRAFPTRVIHAVGVALVSTSVLCFAPMASAGDEPPGWGTAISARVIGERCPGVLSASEIAELDAFIRSDYQLSVDRGVHGPSWWAQLRDGLEESYVEKYSDPANCTDEARRQARDLIEDVRAVAR